MQNSIQFGAFYSKLLNLINIKVRYNLLSFKRKVKVDFHLKLKYKGFNHDKSYSTRESTNSSKFVFSFPNIKDLVSSDLSIYWLYYKLERQHTLSSHAHKQHCQQDL